MYANIGLRGFWMGYFAGRAAPMGAVPADVVQAAFYNFAPGMVRRAIPDAWTFAAPSVIVSARAAAADEALRRHLPAVEAAVDAVLPSLNRAIANAPVVGRPLFAANRALDCAEFRNQRLIRFCAIALRF